jgi:hypothetical protein
LVGECAIAQGQKSNTHTEDGRVSQVNQMKTRLAALGMLDRAFAVATDQELTALIEGLGEDHTEALVRLCGDGELASVRSQIKKGRVDGGMESLAILLTDACLADCIEQLGENADNPDADQMAAVLPGLIERHGIAATRIMLGSALAGEAPASAIIRDLLKNDPILALPKAEAAPRPVVRATHSDGPEREALKAKRRAAREAEKAAQAARREQSRKDRGRI